MRNIYAIIFWLWLLGLPLGLNAQSFNYVQFTTRDGLSGNTVFDMAQDTDGYLWFGTNNGLCRFDGKQFVTFTVKDGLPDNEVLEVFGDSYGRVWLGTFRNELSYYYKGKIYNRTNDSLLAKISLNSWVSEVREWPKGVIWIIGRRELRKFTYTEGNRGAYSTIVPYHSSIDLISIAPKWFGDTFPLLKNDSIFKIVDDKLIFHRIKPKENWNKYMYFPIKKQGDTPYIKFKYDIFRTFEMLNNDYLISTPRGAYEVDGENYDVKEIYLEGKTITTPYLDKEGIYWFTSLGDGVFKLASKNALTVTIKNEVDAINEVVTMYVGSDFILTGHSNSSMFIYDRKWSKRLLDFSNLLPFSRNSRATNKLNTIYTSDNKNFLLGFDAFILNWNGSKFKMDSSITIKSISHDSGDTVIVSTGLSVFRMHARTNQKFDTLWTSRSTCAVAYKNEYFVGTISGLVRVSKSGISKNLGYLHPSLNRRISAMAVFGNYLFVGTSDAGIVCLENNQIKRTYLESDGVSSDVIRTLSVSGSDLWIGTNKGICKISMNDFDKVTSKYNSFNLLPNDIINGISVFNDTIYVATSAGLTFFSESKLNQQSICNLEITNIDTENPLGATDSSISVSYQNPNISISYTGISMKSAGEFNYFYRLRGLDDTWQQTNSSNITFSSLPPGTYTLELYAINKFNVKSAVHSLQIFVSTPFYKTVWFYLGIATLIALAVWQIVQFRNNLVRKELQERNRIQQEIAELEQRALQAQMNPHFIFNCLNSIQQFILNDDAASANRFLSLFAKLIRDTLDNSTRKRILLRKEVDYINRYLELEKMRFGDRLRYNVRVDVDDALIHIPCMLLQPYIENAIRHGLRNLESRQGVIDIVITGDDRTLTCIIRDNGIGREAADLRKSLGHVEYQSRGMDLTQKRVDMLNLSGQELINIVIQDLKDSANIPAGTEVTITIEMLHHESF